MTVFRDTVYERVSAQKWNCINPASKEVLVESNCGGTAKGGSALPLPV